MLKRCLPPSKPQMADTSACAQATLVSRALFLDPPDVVARKLLGKLLVRAGEPMVGRIVEVEAYFGESDPAAHSFAGKTARNAVLFGPPGHAYVYFVYGMHFCLNVSCEPEGRAGCVLLRALEPICGLEAMAVGRGLAAPALAQLPNLRPRPSVPSLRYHAGAGQRRRFYRTRIGFADSG